MARRGVTPRRTALGAGLPTSPKPPTAGLTLCRTTTPPLLVQRDLTLRTHPIQAWNPAQRSTAAPSGPSRPGPSAARRETRRTACGRPGRQFPSAGSRTEHHPRPPTAPASRIRSERRILTRPHPIRIEAGRQQSSRMRAEEGSVAHLQSKLSGWGWVTGLTGRGTHSPVGPEHAILGPLSQVGFVKLALHEQDIQDVAVVRAGGRRSASARSGPRG